MMGLSTFSMIISPKRIPEALLAPDAGHVLIRTPFVVPTSVQFFAMNPLTSCSFRTFPRLPILSMGKFKDVQSCKNNIIDITRTNFWVVTYIIKGVFS